MYIQIDQPSDDGLADECFFFKYGCLVCLLVSHIPIYSSISIKYDYMYPHCIYEHTFYSTLSDREGRCNSKFKYIECENNHHHIMYTNHMNIRGLSDRILFVGYADRQPDWMIMKFAQSHQWTTNTYVLLECNFVWSIRDECLLVMEPVPHDDLCFAYTWQNIIMSDRRIPSLSMSQLGMDAFKIKSFYWHDAHRFDWSHSCDH